MINKNNKVKEEVTETMSLVDMLIQIAALNAELEDDDADASPLDLLTEDELAAMDEALDDYGVMRDFIDDNYVALLIALSTYEEIDIDAKIRQHIADNLKNVG